jgi:hypothetical protein
MLRYSPASRWVIDLDISMASDRAFSARPHWARVYGVPPNYEVPVVSAKPSTRYREITTLELALRV